MVVVDEVETIIYKNSREIVSFYVENKREEPLKIYNKISEKSLMAESSFSSGTLV